MARRLRRPYERVKMNVYNQSARNIPKPVLMVIHSTEGHNRKGIQDLVNLGEYFNNPSVEASSHVGVDAEGHSAQYVKDSRKAWTCAGFNSASLNIEMIGFSSQKWWPSRQEKKVAKYLAYWSKKYGIPLRSGRVDGSTGRIFASGVVRHSDLGAFGGNHGDPGSGFNMGRVIRYAKWYKARGF
jgi:N-acetyl-anhydromuramyl-L-alanine amidase AmpD